MYIISIYGIGQALSSIVHSEVMDRDWEKSTPHGAAKPRRTEYIKGKFINNIGETESIILKLPIVCGNSVRGIGRRLIFKHTMATLGMDIDDLLSDVIARQVKFSFRNGGTSPKGHKIIPAKTIHYNDTLNKIPFLGAFGTVFGGHHFEGEMSIDYLRPYISEITWRYENDFHPELIQSLKSEVVPFAALFGATSNDASIRDTIRYTRCAEIGNDSEDGEKEKEAMIYGVEYIPLGTCLATSSRIVTHNEGAALAFRAMYALMTKHGIVGGMSGRGHGFIRYNLYVNDGNIIEPLDPDKEIANYDNYLIKHKKEITNTIIKMPTLFKNEKK